MSRPAGVFVVVLWTCTAAWAAGEGRVAAERLDARASGAAGDGVDDDGPALQAALDRLAAGGGVLNLPAGVYRVDRPLVIRGDRIALVGEGATLRAGPGFAAGDPAPLVHGRTYGGTAREPVQRRLEVRGLTLDGGETARAGVWIERAEGVVIRDNHVEAVRPGGDGAIVVRATDWRNTDAVDVRVLNNTVAVGGAQRGIVLVGVEGCRVTGNRVQGSGGEGIHGFDLMYSRSCTISDNTALGVDTGFLAEGANHLQFVGNGVTFARTGFRATRRREGEGAHNAVFVDNRVLASGEGFVVQGSGMTLVANYAAFLKSGRAVWVQAGGTHDAVVANNPSVAVAGGIRFDASDGVVVGNVPIANGTSGIEVNGARVVVSGNVLHGNPVGIRLGPDARSCSVLGNVVRDARETPLALGGEDHQVLHNLGGDAALPERGPGARYGAGEVEVRDVRTAVRADFPDDRYQVHVEWTGDPGGREWISDRGAAGFVIALPAAPREPVWARWLARAR